MASRKPVEQAADPIADFGRQLLREDPELREMARTLYRTGMQSMLRDLKAGTPAVKTSIYRLLIPSIMKEATVDPSAEDPAKIAADLHSGLLAALVKGQGQSSPSPDVNNSPVNEGTIEASP